MKRAAVFVLLLVLTLLPADATLAQSPPSCSFQPDGSIFCTAEGGGGGGGGGNGGGGTGGACTPGDHLAYKIIDYDAATKTCSAVPLWVDNCTGEPLEAAGDTVDDMPCELPPQQPPEHPCTTFTITAGGITCSNATWKISARVTFPEIYLDVRPYPATLVRWPTAIRNGGLPNSTGSGGVNYVPNGGGSPSYPQVGDWQDLRLILTLQAAGPMFVTLPQIGDLMLPDQGATGNPMTIQWEVPSHPAVGAGPLAGSVGGLDELPSDIPLFVGNGHAPYKLFWELRYDEYESVEGCVSGPDVNGNYDCGGGTGHRDIVGYDWKPYSSGGEIPPTAVQNLPAALMADLNSDGTPDAYWDNNLTLRRMDNNNRVDNPQYQRSWNWGGLIYWAVREGQGQIGWPGQ